MTITLDQLLASRDRRRQRQQALSEHFPDSTLLCLTVVMPGNEKRTDVSLAVAQAACEALHAAFDATALHWEENDAPTGFELYLVVSVPALDAKQRVCTIEETHPLGRLFDIDVIGSDGIPIPRAAVGREERQCLLCDRPARFCMRNRTHTTGQLLQHIEETVALYLRERARKRDI